MTKARVLWFFFFVLASSALTPAVVQASFEDYPTGARAAGVDGAMTAMADDVYALYYNPAGTAFLSRPELGSYWGNLYGGLSDNSSLSRSFLGYTQPFHGQAIGFSYTALALADLYKEETIGLSYAWALGEHFSVGVTGKHYQKSIGSDFNTDNAALNGSTRLGVSDPVFQNGHQAQAWGGDVSALYRIGDGWRMGWMVRNVNQPNVALGSGDADPAPRSWDWGVAREWGHQAVMLDAWRGLFTQMEDRVHAGYELWLMGGHVGLRAGGGIGEREYREATTGFSYRASLWQADYAFIMPIDTVEGTTGVQQVSLTFRFGHSPQTKAPAVMAASTDNSMRDFIELLNQSATQTNPEPDVTLTPADGPLVMRLYISWNPGQSNLQPQDEPELEKAAQIMRQYPRIRARIDGFTNEKGSESENKRVSEGYAEAVMLELIHRFSIAPERATAKGHGAPQSPASNATPAGRHANCRVDVILTVPP